MIYFPENQIIPLTFNLSVPTFDQEKLLIYRELYYDGFSSILAARDLTSGTAVTVKKAEFIYMNPSPFPIHHLKRRFSRKIRQNAAKMRSISHTSILKMVEFVIEPSRIIVVTEMCMFGDLFNWILQQQMLRVKDVCIIIQYLFQALRYLHSQGHVHGNLMPTHVLFQNMSPQSVTLSLDLSVRYEVMYLTGKTSTVVYGWAPELIRLFLPYEMDLQDLSKISKDESLFKRTQAMDIWSAGVISHIALTGKLPFWGETLIDLLKAIDITQGELKTPILKTFHPIITQKLNQFLNVNPMERQQSDDREEVRWFDEEDIRKDDRNLLSTYEYDMMNTCRCYRLHGRQIFEKIFRKSSSVS